MNIVDDNRLYTELGEIRSIACADGEMADHLDDFLSEHYDGVFFVKFEDDKVVFSFTKDADLVKIDGVIANFLSDYKK